MSNARKEATIQEIEEGSKIVFDLLVPMLKTNHPITTKEQAIEELIHLIMVGDIISETGEYEGAGKAFLDAVMRRLYVHSPSLLSEAFSLSEEKLQEFNTGVCYPDKNDPVHSLVSPDKVVKKDTSKAWDEGASDVIDQAINSNK